MKSIGDFAFANCPSLNSVTLNSNPYIGDGAFQGIAAGATVTMNLTGNEGAKGEYWMTFYNKYYNFEADANTQIFKAALDDTKLTLTELTTDKIVTENNAAILKSTASSIVMTLTTTYSDNDFSGNRLEGVSDPAGLVGDGNYYVLSKGLNGVGFYKLATGTVIGVGKAYLWHEGTNLSNFFSLEGSEATGLNDVRSKMTEVRGDVFFDLSGRRVMNPKKGIYIVNGKKVVVK